MDGDYFYEGADYGFDPEYGGFSQAYSSSLSKNISLATDPRVANQLKAASDKLNTGATAIELSFVSPDVFETIPKQHFEELNRLRKVVGKNVELTLHAPLVEPSGLVKRGWDSYEREQAERQMIDAITKAHKLNPEGNVVTTFHASVAGAPAETIIWEEKMVEGEKRKVPVVKEAYVMNETTGDVATISLKPSYFEGEEEKAINVKEKLNDLNKENWYRDLQHVNYGAEQGASAVEAGLGQKIPKDVDIKENDLLTFYKEYAEGKNYEKEKKLEELGKKHPEVLPVVNETIANSIQKISYGDIHLRDAYNGLKTLFDKAYSAAEKSNSKEDLVRLDEFRKKVAPKLNYLMEPAKVNELAETIREGVHVLHSLSKTPEQFRPLKDFALEKSSETFSNVALNSFKQFGEHSPIISIENPPAGSAIITTADDIRDLIKESRRKFADKAVEKMHLSREHAEREAEKLIGATWDVGHINQLRKYGAGKEELLEQARKIAPMVKHIHLSDNFGLENVELPMGMGNVPKETFKILGEQAKNFEKIKKVIEVGNWYQHFQTTPFAETLRAFGSPLYAPGTGTYWESKGYFSGYGNNPDMHHSIYGAGFTNLPVELGGQMSGRSRVSGAPLE